jgi:hypothetical protein
LGAKFVTAGERERFNSSIALPNLRFHYRYVVVDKAEHAADLVPPRSQAFSAILCNGTNWMTYTSRDSDVTPAGVRARQLYRRYAKEGPLVPWARDFGVCPLSQAPLRRAWAQQFGAHLSPGRRLRLHYPGALRKTPVEALGADFGCACPEPDFDAAARLPRVLFVRHTCHFGGRHRWTLRGLCPFTARLCYNNHAVRSKRRT